MCAELIKWIATSPLPDVVPSELVKHLASLTQPMTHALWFSEVKAQLAKAKSKERLDALTGLMLFPRYVSVTNHTDRFLPPGLYQPTRAS